MPRNKLRSAKEDALNPVEAGMLLNTCRDLLDNLTIRLPLYTGMRIGEVQHLKKSWLDWDKGIIIILAIANISRYLGIDQHLGTQYARRMGCINSASLKANAMETGLYD